MTPWWVALQAPLLMGFPRKEHWSELPFPSAGVLPDPGTEPSPPVLQADSLPTEPAGKSHNWNLVLYNGSIKAFYDYFWLY